jgi:hypothetical protein
MIFSSWATSSISAVETYGTHLPTIMGRGHRLTTIKCPMPFAGILLKESTITGIITDVTTNMEIGEGINISDRAGMKWIGKVTGGADLLTTLQADQIKATGTDLPIIHLPDRIKGIGTGLLTMHRVDKNTTTGAVPLATHQAHQIKATGTGLSITHRPNRIKGIRTGLLTMHRIDRNAAIGADPLAIHQADLILVMGADLLTIIRTDKNKATRVRKVAADNKRLLHFMLFILEI